jgi:hypothetical protein
MVLHLFADQRLLPQNAGVVEEGCVSADLSTYTDCNMMTTVVVGSPGCDKDIDATKQAPQGVAVFQPLYGYGHLTVRFANCESTLVRRPAGTTRPTNPFELMCLFSRLPN